VRRAERRTTLEIKDRRYTRVDQYAHACALQDELQHAMVVACHTKDWRAYAEAKQGYDGVTASLGEIECVMTPLERKHLQRPGATAKPSTARATRTTQQQRVPTLTELKQQLEDFRRLVRGIDQPVPTLDELRRHSEEMQRWRV
jgi:hypothetical protein